MQTLDKITLFLRAFQGRADIVPKHWINKAGRQGYSPLCKNEWKKNICQKPCRTCTNADYVPLSDSLLLDHFRGKHILGVYPLHIDNTSRFIAGDFDDHNGDRNPLQDVLAFYEVCQIQEIPCYVLRSKSGKGYHVYIFLNTSIPAYKPRMVTFALLQEAGVIGDDVELSSFDRLFPNQDELSGRGFGNLIALPFQGNAAKQGHTLFLDPETGFIEPYRDQWKILAGINRVSEARLNDIIMAWDLKRETFNGTGINGEVIKKARNGAKRILDCGFVKWCKEEPAKVPEPLWYGLISNLVCVRPGGYSLCHELSREHPGYNQSETDTKIHQAMDASGPHTCAYIRQNGFKCSRDCGVKAPAGLLFNSTNRQGTGDQDARPHKIKLSFG